MTRRLPLLRPVTAREQCARLAAGAVSVAALLLIAVVAVVRNPGGTPTSAPGRAVPDGAAPEAASSLLRARGEALFAARACSACHSLRGIGNPAAPLDGVGDRMDDEGLRARIVAEDSVRELMPPRVVAAKRRYAELSDEELRALIAFLRAPG